jgi:hypothetical protein
MIGQSEAASPQAAARTPCRGIRPPRSLASILSTTSGNDRSAAGLDH